MYSNITSFYINDKNENKCWIFFIRLKNPTFLNLYNSSDIKKTFYKFIVKIIFRLKLQRYFVSGTCENILDEKYLSLIKNIKQSKIITFSGVNGVLVTKSFENGVAIGKAPTKTMENIDKEQI